MAGVFTTKGIVERDLLEAKDVVMEDENARVIATEWYLNGELVRRDGFVNLLRSGSAMNVESGNAG